MNKKYYEKLIFELSKEGRIGYSLPKNEFGQISDKHKIPDNLLRKSDTILPECDEQTVVRHYTNTSNTNFGVDTGFYPLGRCTMKYHPKINEEIASSQSFNIHPLQHPSTAQGSLLLYDTVQKILSELTGMSRFTLNPYAGAHGELTGLMVIRTYHEKRGDTKRTKIIIPDSAHGTNPASAAVCGLEVVEVKSTPEGTVDVEDLKPLLNDEIAGMMMTNPNTLGIFENKIPEIAKLVHGCGGLMYYDGANLNPMLGVCRPGDMGFDVMHLNLHKTFSTPHGGGGPGAGPVGVKAEFEKYLPNPHVIKNSQGQYDVEFNPDSLCSIASFLGNLAVILTAYAFLLSVGKENSKWMGPLAVLNVNYIKESLKDVYDLPIEGLCKHEFVFNGLKDKSTGVTTLDIAKRLLDYGFHAPTIYFPLLFHEAMMIEPTENESKETIDGFIGVMKQIAREAKENPDTVKSAPHQTPIGRVDDVLAAKHPIVTYKQLINDEQE